MKCLLSLCFLTACIVSLASCDCLGDCTAALQRAVTGQTDLTMICNALGTFVNCAKDSCKVDTSAYLPLIEEELKALGVTCSNLPGSSTVLAGSLVTVLAGLMVAVRRFFIN